MGDGTEMPGRGGCSFSHSLGRLNSHSDVVYHEGIMNAVDTRSELILP